MKSARQPKRLSAGEMELLSLLWEQGGGTIAEVHAAIARPIGYTTVQTRLNRLVAKRLVRRSKDRPAKYVPLLSPHEVSANHLDVLIERVTGGSVVPLVAQLVQDRKLSAADLREIKKIIHEAESQTDAREDRS